MKRKRFLLIGALILATLLVSGIALAREGEPESPADPQGAAETLGTGFTYQGKLEQGGSPVDGGCPMAFRLYDDASTGAQVGSAISRTVTITNGLFTESLDFGTDAFTGDRRWLEIRVDCDDDGTYANLGRQELTAAPYALSLRPGAVISGANASGPILHVENTTGGIGSAVYAKNNGGYAVHAWSVNNTGVYANSESDYGVDGRSKDSCGVHGESKSSYGVCAAGAGGDLWLHNGDIYAVRESGSDMTLYSNDDVYVHLDNDDSNLPKVYSEFQVINANGTTAFSVAENGAVSWYTQTGYVSIPAAAFRPREEGYDFTNRGNQLSNDDNISDQYYAPVQLPHGAAVTKMTFYYSDSSANYASVSLRRIDLPGGGSTTMASVTSVGSSGPGNTETTAIDPDTIDNSVAAYYLYLLLQDSDTVGFAVLIEYDYAGPY
jgi:hypothetical protein